MTSLIKINENQLNTECPICLETITADMPLIRLNCSHQLCLCCYNQYLLTKYNESYGEIEYFRKKLNCPLCRNQIIEKSIEDLKREYARALRIKTDCDIIRFYLDIDNINEDYKVEILRKEYNVRYERSLSRFTYNMEIKTIEDLERIKRALENNDNMVYNENWIDVDNDYNNKLIAIIIVKIDIKRENERLSQENRNNDNNNQESDDDVRIRRDNFERSVRRRGIGRYTCKDAIIDALERMTIRDRNGDNGYSYYPESIMNNAGENGYSFSIDTIKTNLRLLVRDNVLRRLRAGRRFCYYLPQEHRNRLN